MQQLGSAGGSRQKEKPPDRETCLFPACVLSLGRVKEGTFTNVRSEKQSKAEPTKQTRNQPASMEGLQGLWAIHGAQTSVQKPCKLTSRPLEQAANEGREEHEQESSIWSWTLTK